MVHLWWFLGLGLSNDFSGMWNQNPVSATAHLIPWKWPWLGIKEMLEMFARRNRTVGVMCKVHFPSVSKCIQYHSNIGSNGQDPLMWCLFVTVSRTYLWLHGLMNSHLYTSLMHHWRFLGFRLVWRFNWTMKSEFHQSNHTSNPLQNWNEALDVHVMRIPPSKKNTSILWFMYFENC